MSVQSPVLSRNKRLLALATGVFAAAAALLVLLVHSNYARAIVWSGLMLASFTGWGACVNAWFSPSRRADWGLRAGWGMALTILVGGYLCLLHLATRPAFIAQVALGVGALIADLALHGALWRRLSSLAHLRRSAITALSRPGLLVMLGGAYILGAATLLAFLGHKDFNVSDDPPLYFALAEKLMQSGSLLEPFNARRLSTFGGQIYLHATFLSVVPIYFLHAVDAGIGLLMLIGLTIGQVTWPKLKHWHGGPLGLALILLFSLVNIRVNTASILTGFAAVITLYRTLRFPIDFPADRPTWPIEWQRVLLLAVLTFACLALRTSATAALLPFLGLVFLSDWLLATRSPWRRESLVSFVRVGCIFMGGFLVSLLPWSILLKQSCGTYFFPIQHGNLTPGFVFLKSTDRLDEIASTVIASIFYEMPISVLIPFLVAALLPQRGRARNDLVALVLGVLIGLVALAKQAAAFGPHDMVRYYSVYAVPLALMACASIGRVDARAALVIVGVAMHVATSRDSVRQQYEELVREASDAFTSSVAYGESFMQPTEDYREIQSHIPPGATAATAVHEAYRFDFRRNTLFTLDFLGGLGPAPGWPTYKGGEALASYLRANHVQYLVYVDFALPSLFSNRAHWQSHLSKTGSYLAGEAPFELDAMDAIEEIGKLYRVVFTGHGMTVVDLESRP